MIIRLVAQAAMLACHCMMRSTADAISGILRMIYLDTGLRLEVLACHVTHILLGTVRQGSLVDGTTSVLHARIIGYSLLLATLVAAAFHRQTRL